LSRKETRDLDDQSKQAPGEQPGGAQGSDTSARVQQWVKEMESKVRERLKEMEQTLKSEYHNSVPQDVSAHLAKSKEEFLMAVRSIVDRNIERARSQQQSKQSEEKPDSTDNNNPRN
jgi:hypothetical protein